jgi:hypothetical protein
MLAQFIGAMIAAGAAMILFAPRGR